MDLKLNIFKNKLSGLKDIKLAKNSKDLSKKTEPSSELVIDSKIEVTRPPRRVPPSWTTPR